jgi:hypothetical protein
MSEIKFGAVAPKAARKSRYTLASNAVSADERGGVVGLGVDQNEVPFLVYDRATVTEAIQLHAVQTAFAKGAIPVGEFVDLLTGAGKLSELAAAVAAAVKAQPGATEPPKK